MKTDNLPIRAITFASILLSLFSTASPMALGHEVPVEPGTPEYMNVLEAIEFLEQMGDTKIAANCRTLLDQKKIIGFDESGGKYSSGKIYINHDILNPHDDASLPLATRLAWGPGLPIYGAMVAGLINKLQAFKLVLEIAVVLVHEKKHEGQSDVRRAASKIAYATCLGLYTTELEAWLSVIEALLRWAAKILGDTSIPQDERLEKANISLVKARSTLGELRNLNYHKGDKDWDAYLVGLRDSIDRFIRIKEGIEESKKTKKQEIDRLEDSLEALREARERIIRDLQDESLRDRWKELKKEKMRIEHEIEETESQLDGARREYALLEKELTELVDPSVAELPEELRMQIEEQSLPPLPCRERGT